MVEKLTVIDSHTAGEATRVVLAGLPDLGSGDAASRCERFIAQHDHLRQAIVREPRGHEAMVGALLLDPEGSSACAQAIFFNNAGALGMCGHGTIGVVETLRHLGRIEEGENLIETPAGDVPFTLHADGEVSFRNVPSYRYRGAVEVETRNHGTVTGDIAFGGNWFFLCPAGGIPIEGGRIPELLEAATDVRNALQSAAITGDGGAPIDHIELHAPGDSADLRAFVLCPGLQWDRSPCGTGMSAAMACGFAAGDLEPGVTWRQEGVLGTSFSGFFEVDGDRIIPTIRGRAHITGEGHLILGEEDPFRHGFGL